MKRFVKTFGLWAMVVALSLVTAACGGGTASPSASSNANNGQSKPTIKIGSKNFTEQYILGELYAQALEAAGYPVERKLNLGGTLVAFEALKNGEIDLYPEYTGTALLDVLKGEVQSDDKAVYEAVKKGYKEKWNIEVLEQTPFNNGYVLVTTKEVADKYGLKTLSDLSAKAPELRFALIPEFGDRADGLPGLQKTYGGFQFKSAKLFDIGLKYKALTAGQVDVTIGFGTDGQIAGYNLVALEDDKHFWPPYHVVPQVRGELLAKYPEVGEIIGKVNALLTNEVMASLNWKVDGDDKEEPAAVAKEFLEEKGLLK
ncbi:glycine/betaine ABC transporter substrate-binding protein [Brevibacillus sp. SYP-B805]|uniref:glycine betaine ABC transporter substrate-binding protein n=1 Tax=Brevibacillus sp. SYP-B805 TaxID=1578199 RepID=UPI0013E9E22A|nr:glycine betaine ABC transporter substrate-binding protein [Brevibacillus sp. SYP-B805]NGQ94855.1 glycine/betaine ABC transporter substrate-binding protein [Brevibacillus sp. SYP-B805]